MSNQFLLCVKTLSIAIALIAVGCSFAGGPLITKNPAGGGAVTVRIIDGLARNQGVGSFTVCVADALFTYCSGLFTNTVPCTVVVPFA